MKQKIALLLALCTVLLSGCGNTAAGSASSEESSAELPTISAESAADEDSSVEEAVEASVTLNGDSITADSGAEIDGSTVTLTAPGTYTISGTLNDGQIIVDAGKHSDVTLVLSGADIICSTGSPIYVDSAEAVEITLADGTENSVTDGAEYVTTNSSDESETDAAIYAGKTPLVFDGTGTLTVTGNYDNAIHSKDSITMTDGTYTITAADDGIKAKNFVDISGGTISITSDGDAIKTTSEDEGCGYIVIDGGDLTIDAGTDAIQAESDITINGGTLNISTDGGSANAPAHTESMGFGGWFDNGSSTDSDVSAKGLKAGGSITVSGGDIIMDCMDDAFHCADTLTFSDGTCQIATGDDAFHSDNILEISGGTIDISTCYEGLEAVFITVSGGDTTLVSSDDGVNAAGGDSADTDFGFMGPGGSSSETLDTATYYFHMTGGTLSMDASGDGLDSNGAMFIDGGTIYVSGPSDSANGAIDYTTTGAVTAGTVIAAGSSGMAMNFDTSSTQCSFIYTFSSNIAAGSEVTLTDADGNVLASATMAKQFNSVVITCPDLVVGNTYTLTCGDSSVEITLTDTICSLGESAGMGGMGGNMGGGMGGGQMPGGDMGGGSGGGDPGSMTPPNGGTAPAAPANG